MALALYRTYRPGTLAEVVGQPHVTGSLARALDSGRIHHAYLFSGPRGCGKTSTARILARSLNCEQGPTSTPCGTCRSCVELAPNGGGSIDVVELDAATHRGVDDARELRDRAIYAPAASRYKVYIIDEAHQLTSEAANALLKVVEEPPAHLRFVFATTEPDKIIATIRSRTFNYGFRLVPAGELAEHLANVCRSEGVPADPAALAVVARAGAGSVRDSLSVLGQLLAASDSDGLTYANVVAALGVTDSGLLDGFITAVAGADPAAMFDLVDRVVAAGHDPRRFLTDVLDRLRDLMILKVAPQALESGLVAAPSDLAETLISQADLLSLAELSRAADLISGGISAVKGATAPRLQLELLCARLALPVVDSAASGILSRLAVLERRLSGMAPITAPPQGQGPAVAAAAMEPGPPAEAPGPGAALSQARDQGQKPAGDSVAPAPERRQGAAAQPTADTPAPPVAPPRRPAVSGTPNAAERPPSAPAPRVQGGADALVAADVAPAPQQLAQHPRNPGQRSAQDPPSHPAREGHAPGDAADNVGLAAVRQAWPEVLLHLRGLSRVAWMTLESATPVSLSNGALAVGVSDAGRIAFLTRSGHDERLRQSILSVLGLDVTIDVVQAPTANAPRQPASQQREPKRSEAPDAAPANTAGATGAGSSQVVREAVRQGGVQAPAPAWDEPSTDDPDAGDGVVGIELLKRELGGRVISQEEQP